MSERPPYLAEALDTPLGGNRYEGTMAAFGLTTEELQSKKVLDIGSAEINAFGRVAKQHGIDVTSIEPQLIHSYYRDISKATIEFEADGPYPEESLPPANNEVAALAQELPFANDSFDVVTSYAVVPMYISKVDQGKILAEIMRVLKPGGKAYLAPVPSADYSYHTGNTMVPHTRTFEAASFQEAINNSGFEYTAEHYDSFNPKEGVPDERIVLTKPATELPQN